MRVTSEAAMTNGRAGWPFRPATRATIQNKKAISVLLSVRSVPNGKPVQATPKANFWTSGPRTKPPSEEQRDRPEDEPAGIPLLVERGQAGRRREEHPREHDEDVGDEHPGRDGVLEADDDRQIAGQRLRLPVRRQDDLVDELAGRGLPGQAADEPVALPDERRARPIVGGLEPLPLEAALDRRRRRDGHLGVGAGLGAPRQPEAISRPADDGLDPQRDRSAPSSSDRRPEPRVMTTARSQNRPFLMTATP